MTNPEFVEDSEDDFQYFGNVGDESDEEDEESEEESSWEGMGTEGVTEVNMQAAREQLKQLRKNLTGPRGMLMETLTSTSMIQILCHHE